MRCVAHTCRGRQGMARAKRAMSHTAANHACVPSPEARSLSVHPEAHVASAEELALISLSARLLFENGQSTEKVVSALDQLAAALGFRATVFPRWGELTVLINDGSGSRNEILASAPAGVGMRKGMTPTLSPFFDFPSDFLGGMLSVAATVF